MKASGCFQLVFSSSCTVYGEPTELPITEEHETGNITNVYGRTKYFIEEMLKDISRAEKVCTRGKLFKKRTRICPWILFRFSSFCHMAHGKISLVCLTELEHNILKILQPGRCSLQRIDWRGSDEAIYESHAVYRSSSFEAQARIDYIWWRLSYERWYR